MEEKYPYSPTYQQTVLALMLQDPTFLRQYSGAIRAQYFSNDDHVSIVQIVLDHFNKHREIPSRDILDSHIINFCHKAGVNLDIMNRLRGVVHQVCTQQIDNKGAIIETITKWAQVTEVSKVVEKAITILGSGKHEEIEVLPDLFRRAISSGFSADIGVEFFSLAEKLGEIGANSALFDPNKRVPFFLPTINERLNGGLGPGELGMIMGKSKSGKSIVLTNVAAVASAFYHKRVVYITNELKPEQVMLRIATRLTGVSEKDIIRGDPRYIKAIHQWLGGDQKVHIQYYSPDTATVDTIRNYLAQLHLIKNMKPEVLIVDDADHIRGPGANSFERLLKIYTELIQTGDEFECPVYTASQFNRDGYPDKDHPDYDGSMSNVQGSIGKVQQASLIVTLAQSDKERPQNRCRAIVFGARRGPDNYTVQCDINKELMIITEHVKEEQQVVATSEGLPPPPPPPPAPPSGPASGNGSPPLPPPLPPPPTGVYNFEPPAVKIR